VSVESGTGRIGTLVDGVFAIAMTLLVLELIPSGSTEGSLASLIGAWPKFYAYAMGFLVLGIFWALHRSIFGHIRRSDEILVWLNILFLLFVALIPFSTAILGQRPPSRGAVVLYGSNMIAVSLPLGGMWWYATGGSRLVAPDLDPRLVRHRRMAFALVPLGFAVGVGLSFVSTALSLGLFSLMAVFYIASSALLRRYRDGEHLTGSGP